jgi:hypothetical protein
LHPSDEFALDGGRDSAVEETVALRDGAGAQFGQTLFFQNHLSSDELKRRPTPREDDERDLRGHYFPGYDGDRSQLSLSGE